MKPIELFEIPKEIMKNTKAITFPKQGCTSDVGIIETSEGKFVVKRSKNQLYRQWLADEANILKQLEATQLAIPKSHRFFEDREQGQSWILMDYIEGKPLGEVLHESHNEEERLHLIYQFGNKLKTLHETPCPKALITDKPWLEDMLEQSQYNFDHYEVDGSQQLLDQLKKTRPKPFKQTLIHGDFTIDNVLVNDGKIVAIIDWSGGAYGDPRYDAALAIRPKPNAFEKEVDKEVFFEGYGEKIIDEKEYWYFEQGLYEFF
ncbi:phosphotransferase [Ornithinibacillus sp. L9]|uniref:Phosphotransferase n=1 Tax=Ornithinibacillus caprae TaxID=2678566 RepID=A0A6N8FNJ3_9BACI|nr:aminoglycoside phosphotransferase family protein [Ornithinibacillus caprae]MUK90386.1 phosphotransferase [Ornithinibacillus caprae]